MHVVRSAGDSSAHAASLAGAFPLIDTSGTATIDAMCAILLSQRADALVALSSPLAVTYVVMECLVAERCGKRYAQEGKHAPGKTHTTLACSGQVETLGGARRGRQAHPSQGPHSPRFAWLESSRLRRDDRFCRPFVACVPS